MGTAYRGRAFRSSTEGTGGNDGGGTKGGGTGNGEGGGTGKEGRFKYTSYYDMYDLGIWTLRSPRIMNQATRN